MSGLKELGVCKNGWFTRYNKKRLSGEVVSAQKHNWDSGSDSGLSAAGWMTVAKHAGEQVTCAGIPSRARQSDIGLHGRFLLQIGTNQYGGSHYPWTHLISPAADILSRGKTFGKPFRCIYPDCHWCPGNTGNRARSQGKAGENPPFPVGISFPSPRHRRNHVW
jgi:hypothetical protein